MTVTADDDSIAEGEETATLTHSVSDYGTVTTADSVTVTIADNDTAGVTVSPTAVTATEGGATGSYTVALDTQPTGTVTVTVGDTSDDIAASPETLTFTTANWNTAQTVTVTADDDSIAEGEETATLTHSVSDYGTVTTADSVTVTIADNDTAGVTVSPTAVTATEGGATGSYTVALDTQPTGTVTVTVGDTSDDITASPETLTFTTANWNTAQTVTVTADDDSIAEGEETATLTHSVSDYGTVTTADSVTVTIADNDTAGVTVSPTAVTATEGGATGSYTVALDTQPTGTVTVTVGDTSDDITASPETLTFTTANWNTAQTVTVTADDDSIAEGEETATLTHSVSDYGTVTTADSVTVTIADNDTAGVTVSPTAVTATEGGATGSYTVALDTQPTGTVTVTVGDTSDDITASPETLTFTTANWNTAQTVTVTADDDSIAEGEETATLTHSVSDYGTVTTADSVTVTIADNDTAGVTVSPTAVTATEGGATGSYTVALDTQPTGTVTVTVGDTSDDITASPETLTFTTANWNTAQTVTVTADDDSIAEGEETATLTHSVSDYGTVTTADSVTVTIADNDTAGVTVSPTAVTATEGGATGSYTVALDTQPTGTVTVTVGDTSDDITASPETLTFTTANWNTAQTVTVTADDDSIAEGEETATLTHSVSDYGTVTTADSVTVTIADNDTAGVTVSPTAVTATEGGATGSYTVALDTQPTGTVTVTVGDTSDDITASPETLTFTTANWNTAQTVTVTADDDSIAEGEETATLTHSVSDYGTVTTADSVTVTIADNDTAGVTVSPTAVTATEGGATGSYTVALDTQPTGTVTVTVGDTSDDITASPETLTFTTANWNTAQTVTVTADDDSIAEGEETATLTHSVSDYGTVTTADSVTVTIADNDTAGVTVSPTAVTATEGGATGSYTVALDTQPTGTVTVTVGDTSDDITASPETLTFTTANWNTAQTVTVTADDDSIAEGEETATLTHSVSDYGTVTTADSVTVTIADNDTAGVTVSPTAVTATEGGATGSYTVALDTQPTGTVTVTVGDTSDDITASPETLTFTTANWNTAQTVTVTADDDSIAEGEETATLTHSVSDYGTVTTADSVTVTIADNDTAGVTVSPTAVTATEGGATGSYTVALDTQPTGTVTVTVGDTSDDIAASPETLTFTTANWNTAQTVTVTADDDSIAEGEETATLTHSVSDYGTVTTADSVTVTIADNDTAGVTVSPTAVTATEGGATGSYTVALDTQPTGTVTVTVGDTSDDITASPETLTFTTANWNTAQTVTVTADDDSIAEGEETATLTHSVSDYGTVTTADSVTVTVKTTTRQS